MLSGSWARGKWMIATANDYRIFSGGYENILDLDSDHGCTALYIRTTTKSYTL